MLKSAIRRWRERRRERRTRALEEKVTADQNLRNYQPPTPPPHTHGFPP